jgi:ketosteroid isomerase-like protein
MKEPIQIIQDMYNNFAKGDVEAVVSSMKEDTVWNEAENFPYADGNPYIGPEAIVGGVFGRIGEEWEYWKLADLQLMEVENEMVLATGRYQAKHKKTGKEIDAQMAHLWWTKDGKVIRFQQYADTKQVAEAIIT